MNAQIARGTAMTPVDRGSSSEVRDELPQCPIPLTHRRLKHAHLLWHQCLDAYHDPERFLANLNATIEALRNVTFVVQKEKSAFKDFDGWYKPRQEILKADATAKWLNDARVTIVHQGDLESSSNAEVRIITYEEKTIWTCEVPIHTPAKLILENPSLLALLDSSKNKFPDLADSVLLIERKWSTKELNGREILSALAHVYGLLADLVLDAHSRLGQFACIPAEEPHPDFRALQDRTGLLRCMSAGVEARTERYKTDKETKIVATPETVRTLINVNEILGRYGVDPRRSNAEIQNQDPVEVAEWVLKMAKRILRRDKHHDRIMFIRDGEGQWHQITIYSQDKTEKIVVMQMVASFVENRGCDALIEVGEMWTASIPIELLPGVKGAEHARNRGELLSVVVVTREGLVRQYKTPFTRGPFGGLKLGDTEQMKGFHPNYLVPVFRVWQRQRFYKTQDGRDSMVWEPDLLAPCPCGGPRRFGVCCKSSLPNTDQGHVRDRVAQAISAGEGERAESIARAGLAQYVIWVRQHTAAAIHMGREFYDGIVQVDALALESLIGTMIDALEFAGKAELILPQLQRLRGAIGVPRLATRIGAISARWLFLSGHQEEAVLELDRLGSPYQLSDTLAIWLVVRNYDLSEKQRESLLSRAIDVAASDEEKNLARLEMASYYLVNGKSGQALSLVQAIVDETSSGNASDELSRATVLKWAITEDDNEFPLALAEMKRQTDDSERIRNGVFLIDRGKYGEAEEILSELVESGNIKAILLLVDARLRSGRSDEAREMFLSIARERLSKALKYPYAHTLGLLVLAGGHSDLKEDSITLLSEIPPMGGEPDRQVRTILEILKGK
jgi:hypothetical protein